MNADKRAELRQLLDPDSLTPGPWSVPDVDPTSVYRTFDFFGAQEEHVADTVTPDDARFIAAAREAVPDLLDTIDKLADAIHRLGSRHYLTASGHCRGCGVKHLCATTYEIEQLAPIIGPAR